MSQIAHIRQAFICVIPPGGTGPADSPPVPNFAAMQLQNYVAGQWVAGTGKQAELVDASTGELVATTNL